MNIITNLYNRTNNKESETIEVTNPVRTTKNYISESKIKQLASICNRTYTKEIKEKLREIGKKYDLDFSYDNQTNANLFFTYLCEELKKDTTITFGWKHETFTQRIAGGWSYDTQTMFTTFLEKNPEYQEDYNFIWNFHPENIILEINAVLQESLIYYEVISVKELHDTDNYEKYFSERYGIQTIDEKARKDGERVISFIDNLLEGIPNKRGFMIAFNEYLETQDKVKFHNKLFQTDY